MTLPELCDYLGLTSVTCDRCGKKHNALPLIKQLFKEIVVTCKTGERVFIEHFGIFEMRTRKGGLIKTGLVSDGKMIVADRRGLKFKQSKVVKRTLEEG